MNWRDALRGHLLELQPASAYALDESAFHLLQNTLPTVPTYTHDKPHESTCTLALGVDAFNGLNVQQTLHLISQTRLYIAPRILLAVSSDCALDDGGFRALGFMQTATNDPDGMRIFHYDLTTYKTVPDWLNSRFWAHPERWRP